MSRRHMERAISELTVDGRISERDLPQEEVVGARKRYLQPL
jgi:hypothetical protein